MTIRDLLSTFDKNAAVRLHIFDSEWTIKELNICFNPDPRTERVYEDDMEELDKIADHKIARWYVYQNALHIKITDEFKR